jgi:RNA polymerase sigma-70 factor (TIGR02952 family)
MSSHVEPDPTAIGLRALYAAIEAHRAAARLVARPGVVWRARRRPADVRAENGNGNGDGTVPLQRAPIDGVQVPAAAGAPGEPPASYEPNGAEGPDGETWGLVRAAQSGDAEAFGRLYDRYVGLVYRYAYHRLGDRPQAEDVTSETFLRALRRIGTLQYQGRDIGAWFVTIARNLVLDHRKSGRARLEVATAELPEHDAGDRPEAAVLTRIANASLLDCVRQLNPEQQECVVLRFFNGMSVAETAEIMDKNEGAIKALQHRAIRRLATLLPEDPR